MSLVCVMFLNMYNVSLFCAGFGSLCLSLAPKMKDLANCVAAIIPYKWKQVAIQLELSRGDIKTIEKDENDCFDRFMAVLDKWKQSAQHPYTWEALVTALRSKSVDENKLADEIQKTF